MAVPRLNSDASSRLTYIGARRPLVDSRELWAYRELLVFLVWRDLKVRYKQTLIGVAWAFIQPLFSMIVFTLFFGKLDKIPSNGMPYHIFYYSAFLPWSFFANAIQNATRTIVENRDLVNRVYFPRLFLPVAKFFTGLVDFFIAILLHFVLMFL